MRLGFNPKLPGGCRLWVKKAASAESESASSYKNNSQAFSTWLNSSSTGVARPKMVTDTRTLLFS